jgi:hypothetical protein
MKGANIMKLVNNHKRHRWVLTAGLLLLAGCLAMPMLAAKTAHADHPAAQATDNQALADQIQQLQQQVATLQAILQKQNRQRRSSAMGSGGTMSGGGKMTMMDDDMSQMGGMSSGGKSSGGGSMGMMEGEMGGMSSGGNMKMCCMGEMGGMMGGMRSSGMGGMKRSSSAMPGQPGASHLYHVGSTGFFLDHAKHIALTPEQKTTLNRLKEKALLDRATQQRRIDGAEQELYMLTGADQPDVAQIQAKIAELEKLRADQRMNFIRAVGEAAKVLTHDQHRTLLGTMTSKQQ